MAPLLLPGTFHRWVGTELLCTQATQTHIVPAGGASVTVFELQAVLLVSDTATDPEPGTYLVGMSLFPELATPLQVSP